MLYLGAEDPPLGIMLSILKTTSQNFGLAIQDQISIKHKLENIEGLPTLELDFLSTDGQDGSAAEPTERPNLHQKQQIAKNALEKKYKVRNFRGYPHFTPLLYSHFYPHFTPKMCNLIFRCNKNCYTCSTSSWKVFYL